MRLTCSRWAWCYHGNQCAGHHQDHTERAPARRSSGVHPRPGPGSGAGAQRNHWVHRPQRAGLTRVLRAEGPSGGPEPHETQQESNLSWWSSQKIQLLITHQRFVSSSNTSHNSIRRHKRDHWDRDQDLWGHVRGKSFSFWYKLQGRYLKNDAFRFKV